MASIAPRRRSLTRWLGHRLRRPRPAYYVCISTVCPESRLMWASDAGDPTGDLCPACGSDGLELA